MLLTVCGYPILIYYASLVCFQSCSVSKEVDANSKEAKEAEKTEKEPEKKEEIKDSPASSSVPGYVRMLKVVRFYLRLCEKSS